ncbi:hypothetical protein [Phenylobacterium sp.]|jgi:flagellar biosynthesis protein FliP|uniref:hypothetical protein n=1 Tax=Phenylobacterium sp. TaxID=1871053 RepID=UPI000C8A44E3|nr:hypothetical protein [Phenylobacterium sp.]MAK81958.1 hypothetical protein [Phenylobacterium sp.]MCA3710886.1 hypothetical protein [Phenylobacterium sp.]MCA6240006.1 hypothetical protein [Phenylobacterium sp.]|tara:strand:+ start:26855 stop:27151 length:297 start_codon:yes stop_codon:yes gene_type:complete
MDARSLPAAILRGAGTAMRYVVFFAMLHCRPLVKLLLRGYMVVGVAFVVLGLALKLDVPTAAFVVNGVAVFLAALLSWKYDTMLMWLTPDGRRLILDV